MKKTLRKILPPLFALFLAFALMPVYEGFQHQRSWYHVAVRVATYATVILLIPVIALFVTRARNRKKKNSSPELDDEGR
ncbi:hypothetical protein OG241_09590 [Streptomyces sp. NBC_01390]|uniref:hypothetical protein n=1 Tax=Streptomyces sp. NBC_01390 TaxID=2903850 RepID=UPI003246D1B1